MPDTLDQLQPLVDALCDACHTTARDLSELREAVELAGVAPAPLNLGYTELMPDATTGEYAYAKLRQLFSEFLAREPGTRLGEDPEELHQMRVAARRLRSTIGLFEPAIAPRLRWLTDELRWAAGVLGDARDLQVQEETLGGALSTSGPGEAAALRPLVGGLQESAGQAQSDVVAALDSQRYQSLVRRMTAALRDGYDSGDEASLPVSVFASQALRRRFKSVRKQASRIIADSPDTDLHELRIRAKKLRYALETFQPMYGSRTRRMIARTKALQDLLGEHQDHAFAREWMRENALRNEDLPPETLIEVGELIERRRQEMDEIRGRWNDAYAKVRKAWKRTRKEIKASLRILAVHLLDKDQSPPEPAVQRPLSGFGS